MPARARQRRRPRCGPSSDEYGSDFDDTGAVLVLPGYGYGLPRWSGGVNPAAWYREGREIAACLAAELPGVTVRLAAIRYVCAPRFLHSTKFDDDDEFFTPISG